MPGPLPKPANQRRRKNKPTIPTTDLPAGGRSGPAPRVPSWMTLDAAARGWWAWAWRTPQAAAWDDGSVAVVARRAQLEDIVLEMDKPSDATAIRREMRELDDRLGLTPKGLSALHWRIVADEEEERPAARPASIHRLQAVDARAVAGA